MTTFVVGALFLVILQIFAEQVKTGRGCREQNAAQSFYEMFYRRSMLKRLDFLVVQTGKQTAIRSVGL
jgi:hypothetical protein